MTKTVGAFDSRAWIGSVDVPTVVLTLTEDRVVDPDDQISLAGSLPGATVHPVAGDHGACVVRPRVFVPALVKAPEQVARRASQPDAAG